MEDCSNKVLFDEYRSLYKKRYGEQGPSISSGGEHHTPDPENCGCWHCQLVALRTWQANQ
jgi:hypothetical protein